MDIIEYQVDHPLIENAWSHEYESGIITIWFNCTEQDFEIDSHSYNKSEYVFDKYGLLDYSNLPHVKLKSTHIDKLEAGWYHKSLSQENHQITYIFIPIYMMVNKNMWIKHRDKILTELPERFNVIQKNITLANNEDLPIWEKELKQLELKQKFYEN